jgi:hypothetical protein
MRSNTREEVLGTFDALVAGLDRALDLSFDALTTPERLALLERCERLRRRLPALEHPLINQVAEQADSEELGGKLPWALADRLRITRAEARRRIAAAADLGERRNMVGESLPPVLPETAAAQRDGQMGGTAVEVIRGFWHRLPTDVDVETRARAEKHLAGLGREHRPDELAKLADRLTDCLNPDGVFSDVDRAHRRGLVIGKQDADGMSPITGWLDPLTRAGLDAVLARWAARGMCNPDDDSPCRSGTPSQDAIDNDRRSAGQRNHDALAAMCANLLASGELGSHHGLPATLVVSFSLGELEAAAGKATTAGGTWLPLRDVIRLASGAHHYLRIYDGAKEIALYHGKRLANPGQRLVLYAKERGCSHPGCPVPALLTEVHHNSDYARSHRTDIDDLTLRCGPHHRLLSGGWRTRKRCDGVIETLPPPHLDRGQPRTNGYHHPEKLLRDSADEDDPEDP